MSKRRDDGDTMTYPSPKRRRISQNSDYLSFLSDEVLLYILSYLPIPALLKCQRYAYFRRSSSWQKANLLLPL